MTQTSGAGGISAPAFLALACVGFIAAPVHAETADPVSDGDTDGQGRTVQDRDQIIVTGQIEGEQIGPKATAKVVNTPRSVVVLPAKVIEDSGSATLAEVLRTVPGITFGAAEGGNPVGDRPFIRGYDSQGSVFVDGVRDPAAQSRETFAVERVQIVRGSDSTLGGRGSAGGSINIITKLPTADDSYTATLSYGTDDYKRVTFDMNQRVGDLVAVRVAGMAHDQDIAGRDALWARRWGVAPSVTIGIGSPTRLTIAGYYLETEELPDSGIPYLYNLANAPLGNSFVTPAVGRVTTIAGVTGTVPREAFYGLVDRDFRDTTTIQATMRVEHNLSDAIMLRNTSRFTRNDQAYIWTQPDDQQGNVFGTDTTPPIGDVAATAGGLVWRRANTRYGYVESIVNQTDLYGTVDTGSITHSFAAGVELAWEKARRGTFVTRGFLNASGAEQLSTGTGITPRCTPEALARFYCTSLFAPDPHDPWVNYANDTSTVASPIVRSLPIAETQNRGTTMGVYAFDSITLTPSLILNLGARFDRFKSTVTPGQPVTATSSFSLHRTDELFNWQAGLVFKPSANTSLYASYATSATPPNSLLGEGSEGNALGTSNNAAAIALLRPEKSRNYELGAKAELFGGGLALNLAAFQTETKNARVLGADNSVAFVGERRIRGVEVGVNGQVGNWLSLFGGYTYLDAVIVDGGFTALTAPAVTGQAAKIVLVPSVNTGRRAPTTPEHSFTMWAEVKPAPGVSIGGGAFYTSGVVGGYQDNRSATQNSAGVVTINPATKVMTRGVPDYWRFDLRLGYEIDDHWEISANVQNLTDEVYFSQAFTAHYATIAPGRSAFATLRFRY